MAKQIIVLSRGAAAVTNNSAWTGASAAENTAIQNGSVLEEVRAFTFPVGTASAAIKEYLQQAWTERNGEINGVGPNVYMGIYLDPVAIASNGGWSA